MTAGDLKDRVTWQRPVRADGDTGQAVVSWVDALTTWANVKPVAGGSENDRNAQQTTTRGTEITVRSRTVDVQPDWRAVWVNRNGLVLNIVAVNPHPNGGEFVLVTCTE